MLDEPHVIETSLVCEHTLFHCFFNDEVIVECGGHAINNSRMRPKEVVYTPYGEEVSLKLVRGGKTMTIGVTLQPFPEHIMS